MKGRTKGIVAGGVIAVVLLLVGLGFWTERRWRASLTAEAPARVTSVTVEKRRRRMGHRTVTRVGYSFEVGGRTLQDFCDKNGDQNKTYTSAADLKVCYNPSNPDESEVFPPDHQCGK